jgi:hypothetical protein
MLNPFKRIRCQCAFCNKAWRIPRRRILHFEKFFNIKKGSASGGSGNAMIATKGCLSWVLIRTFMENRENWFRLPWFKHWSYAFLTSIPWFQYSIIPCRQHKPSAAKSYIISIYYRNSETFNYIFLARRPRTSKTVVPEGREKWVWAIIKRRSE